MKKNLSKVFVGLIPLLLAGCGGNSATADNSTTTTTTSDQSTASESVEQPSYAPDQTSPDFTLAYSHDTSLKNDAEGTLVVFKENTCSSEIKRLSVEWGDDEDCFEDYSPIALYDELNRSDFECRFSANSLIPTEATKLWVVGEREDGSVVSKASVGMESYKESKSLLYSFSVLSDTHVTNKTSGFYRRTKKAFEDIKLEMPNSPIIVNGDIIDEASQAEYDAFFDAYDSVFESREQMTIGLGNHEFIVQSENDQYLDKDEEKLKKAYSDRLALWESNTGNDSPYFYKVMNGSYFIFLGTTAMPETLAGNSRADCVLGEEQLTWFEDTMALAGATDKPIFVFSHGSLRDTVSGSLTQEGQTWFGYQESEEAKIREVISKYPKTNFFSSHSHWCFESDFPYLIEDGNPSFFNTASVGYLWEGKGNGKHYKDSGYDNGGGQGLYLEVYEDQILIKGREFEDVDGVSKYWYSGYQVVLPY